MTIKDLTWRVLYSLYFITGLTNLFINGGRTGQVTFLFTLFVLAVFHLKLSLKKLLGLFVTLVTVLLLAYNFSPNFHDRIGQLQTDMSNMYEKNEFTGSLSIRFALWRVGLDVFIDNPILGTGIGGETANIKEYALAHNFNHLEKFTDYHNSFIQYAVQLGIIGLLIPIFIFYQLFTLKFQTEQYKLLSTAFTTIFILHAMGGFSFHILDSLAFLCTFAALFNAISFKEKLIYK